MTPVELRRANLTYKGKASAETSAALSTAINRAKNEGGRTLDAMAKVIDDAKKEVLAFSKDGNPVLSAEELTKAKTTLSSALIAFAQVRIARMLVKVGDVLADHEQRLATIEAARGG